MKYKVTATMDVVNDSYSETVSRVTFQPSQSGWKNPLVVIVSEKEQRPIEFSDNKEAYDEYIKLVEKAKSESVGVGVWEEGPRDFKGLLNGKYKKEGFAISLEAVLYFKKSLREVTTKRQFIEAGYTLNKI